MYLITNYNEQDATFISFDLTNLLKIFTFNRDLQYSLTLSWTDETVEHVLEAEVENTQTTTWRHFVIKTESRPKTVKIVENAEIITLQLYLQDINIANNANIDPKIIISTDSDNCYGILLTTLKN